MKFKKALAFSALFFTTAFFIVALLSNRYSVPLMGKLSDNVYAFVEAPKRSLLGLSIPYLNQLLPNIPFVDSQSNYLQNACLNGSDPSDMDTQEQLLQFIQGPCLPVVLVPGLLASKLQVNIDCETLQSENPEIFSSCGWGTCNPLNVLKGMPASSYTLWISNFVGPVSLVLNSTVTCWGNLIQLQINESATELDMKYQSPVGVDVILKSTYLTNQEECGLSTEDNLLISPVQPEATIGYENMKNALVAMGYQVGLTLYGAPYDWRKTTVANGIGVVLNNTIKQIYSLTGKPTVIIAHSLGNFGALYLLNSLTAEEKQMYIANYVSLVNPLAGAPKAILSFMGGDTEYSFEYFDNAFGVTYEAQKMLLSNSTGMYDVVPKDPFHLFANEQWMQDWQSRMTLENTYNVDTTDGQEAWTDIVDSGNYTYQWFPTPLQQCFQGFQNRSDQCGMYMYNWSAEPIVTVAQESFTVSTTDISDLFDAFVEITDIAPELAADCQTNGIYLLTNPEVPTTIVYASHLYTYKSYEYATDPRESTENNEYAVPTVINYSQGDETVPTTSALLPALKWSWEFDNKEQAGIPNAQPVKTVEICSIYNDRGTIYDVASESGPYKTLNNEYIGVGCECQPQGNATTVGTSCSHSAIVADSVLIQFIQNIVNANYLVANYTSTGAYALNSTQLDQIASNCPCVNYGPNMYFDMLEQATQQQELVFV